MTVLSAIMIFVIVVATGYIIVAPWVSELLPIAGALTSASIVSMTFVANSNADDPYYDGFYSDRVLWNWLFVNISWVAYLVLGTLLSHYLRKRKLARLEALQERLEKMKDAARQAGQATDGQEEAS